MGYDSTADDSDEPHAERATARTDGGSEAEAKQPDDSDGADESESESGDSGEADASTEGESTEEAQTQESESTDEADDSEHAAEPASVDVDDEAVTEQTGDVGVEPETEDEAEATAEETEAEAEESTPSLDGEGDTASIIEIRNQVIELSTDVIGRGLDGIIEVSRDEDNWRAVVEIIERRSVPDTQDILGQYEIELDNDGEVIGYRRLEKYRRSDTGPSDY